jgi:hypothetical protein
MQMLPLESLICLQSGGRSALTVPELLSVLVYKSATIYGYNKLLTCCQIYQNRRKTATVIISGSFEGRTVVCWKDRWVATSCNAEQLTSFVPLPGKCAAAPAQRGQHRDFSSSLPSVQHNLSTVISRAFLHLLLVVLCPDDMLSPPHYQSFQTSVCMLPFLLPLRS